MPSRLEMVVEALHVDWLAEEEVESPADPVLEVDGDGRASREVGGRRPEFDQFLPGCLCTLRNYLAAQRRESHSGRAKFRARARTCSSIPRAWEASKMAL